MVVKKMYQFQSQKSKGYKTTKPKAWRPSSRKYYQARATEQSRQQGGGGFSNEPRGSWFNKPLREIAGGLDYLATYNPLESIEAIGGMVKESLASAKKFVKSPFELHKLVKYNSEVKELNKAKQQGKISEQRYKSRMGVIGAETKRLSKEYDPKTAVGDALSASMLIPGAGATGKMAKGAFSFLEREGIKSLVKPTIAKGAGLGLKSTMRETGRALISRPLSTPISKGIMKVSTRLAEGKAVVDTVPQITGKDFTPIKLMKEGKAREAVKFAGMMATPIPYVGKALTGISKGKKFVGSATEYQASETAFKRHFGKMMEGVSNDDKAKMFAQQIKVLKERAIPVNEKNMLANLKSQMNPPVQEMGGISNTVKRILKANGIKTVDELKGLTDDMLKKIGVEEKSIPKLKEAIEEMGKTQWTASTFKTTDEQFKALQTFHYTGVHTGTWKKTPKELKEFVEGTYSRIKKHGGEIKGPEIGAPKIKIPEYKDWIKTNPEALAKIKGFKVEARKIKSEDEAVKFLKDKRSQFDTEFSKKYKSEFKISDTKEIVPYKKPPPPKYAFTMKQNKIVSGDWKNNRAAMGMSEATESTLYSQGVRDLPKGDASFLAGRKAELGRTLNKMREGRLGKILMPQNSREIYHGIRERLDNSLVKAFGKDTGKAEKAIHKELNRPLIDSWNIKIPLYRPTERELGNKAWKRIISETTGESIDSNNVKALAKQMNKETRESFVTSMEKAGVPTNLIDKMRSTSGWFNWAFYNLYTLPRFQLRTGFWMQQVPEVYQWGHARTSKLVQGSKSRILGNKFIDLKQTINLKSELSKRQKAIGDILLGQTEEISGAGVRGMMFSRKNEANAYSLGFLLEFNKAIETQPVIKAYLKKHGLKRADEIPLLGKKFYDPMIDDIDNMADIFNKYGFSGAKAHLADSTKTVLKYGTEDAIFDNAIREAIKIAKPNAYKEAIPLFLYNPNRCALEKSLHTWPMFPLSYAIKVAERGGGYILEGKAIRSKVFASIINTTQDFHENEEIKKMERDYYNLFNAAEGLLPIDPSYPFSTGFLPPFSKMLWRWAENPEYYLDEKHGTERSMKILWPAYREAKGWQQVYGNIKRLNKKVRESGEMTEEEAKKIIEEFRFKEPPKIPKLKKKEFQARPKEESVLRDNRTAQEKTFAEKKARRDKLLNIKPQEEKTEKKYAPKIVVPKSYKPKTSPKRKKYSE